MRLTPQHFGKYQENLQIVGNRAAKVGKTAMDHSPEKEREDTKQVARGSVLEGQNLLVELCEGAKNITRLCAFPG